MFLERLAGLFSGRGFQTKKEDEEEKRRARQSAPAKATPTPTAPSTPRSASAGLSGMSLLPQKPGTNRSSLSIIPVAEEDPYEGLSKEDKEVARKLKQRGKDPTKYVEAARQSEQIRKQANWDNSLIGKATNFAQEVPGAAWDVVTGGVQDLGRAVGTAAASNSQAVREADRARQEAMRADQEITASIARRLRDPNTDPAMRARLTALQRQRATDPDAAGAAYEDMYREMRENTDPKKVILGAFDTATLPLVGGLAGARALPGMVSKGAETFVDPLTALKFIPEDSFIGKAIGADLNPFRRLGMPDINVRPDATLPERPTRGPSGVDAPPIDVTGQPQLPTQPETAPQQGRAPTPAPAPVASPREAAAARVLAESFSQIETKIKRPLSDIEQQQIIEGQAPKEVVDEAAQIGSGISTPSTRAKAEEDIISVRDVAETEAEAVTSALPPEVIEPAAPVRPSLVDQINAALHLPTGRAAEAGFHKVPFSGKADNLDAEPSMEDLAKIETSGLADPIGETHNIEVEFLQGEIRQLADLARRREMAGASETSLQPIYDQIDAKEAELRRMMTPQKPTKAQQKAAVQNERVAEAQRNLEEVTGAAPAKPAKASKKVVQEPAPVKAQQQAAVAAESLKPTKANKALKDDLEAISKMSDEQLAETSIGATQTVEPPKKATRRNKAVQETKQQAVNVETTKVAAREQAKALKKVAKAVKKAEGETGTQKAAPNLAKKMAREYADGSDLARTMEGLAATRDKKSHIQQAVKSVKRVAKQSDDEVLADSTNVNLGLGDKAETADKVTHAAQGLIPRLARMRKAAEAAGDVERTKSITVAFDNVMKQITEASSDAGTTNSAVAYAYKNAGPDLAHARVKKSFEDKGGAMTPEQDKAFRETYEQVYTAQKDLDAISEKWSTAMDNFKKRKRIKDSDIKSLREEKKRLEDILENALAENERVAGEIFEANVKAGKIKDDTVGRFGPAYEGWRKAAMLSAPTGRLRDMISTTFAMGDRVATDTIEAAINKVFRVKGGPQSFGIDTDAVVRGTREGIKNIQQIARGERKGGIYVDAGPEAMGRKYKGAKTQLSPAPRKQSKVVRGINAASAAPTEMYRGYRENRLLQYADIEGRRRGYTGKQLKQFKELYSINPPKALEDAVDQDFFLPSSMQENFVTKFADWADSTIRAKAADTKNPKARKVADWLVREVGMLTMPFKKYAGGSLHRMMTDKNIAHNVAGLVKAGVKRDGARASKHAARLTVNTAQLGLASALILPHMSETDANGDSYSPPYLKIGDNYVPLQSLGPALAAPLGAVWANKKFMDNLADTKNPAAAAADWTKAYSTILLQSTGMDSLVAGDSPLVRAFTGLGQGAREESGSNWFDRVGGRFAQDVMTQWVPAASRDLNAVIDSLIEYAGGNQYAPETRVEDEDGKKKYFASGVMTTLAALPGVRQWMASNNPSEKANSTLGTRLLGGNRASDAAKQNAADKQAKEERAATELERSKQRISALTANDKIRDSLDEEARDIFDKVAGGNTKKLEQSDYDKVESALKKAEEKFLYDSDYDTYLSAVELRREKLANDPSTSAKDLEAVDFDINVAKALQEREFDYDIYNMYAGSSKSGDDSTGMKAGISESELKKLLDDESPYYNPALARQLMVLDEYMAEKGLSDNSLNTKMPKYKAVIDAARGKSTGKGRGSGPRVITNVGSVGSGKLGPEGPKLQYREIKPWESPLPNLSKQASRTNFKKNITVRKGVVL